MQIKFLKMEMEKKTKIIKDLQQEVPNDLLMCFSLEWDIVELSKLYKWPYIGFMPEKHLSVIAVLMVNLFSPNRLFCMFRIRLGTSIAFLSTYFSIRFEGCFDEGFGLWVGLRLGFFIGMLI